MASDAYGRKKTLLVVPGPTSSSAVMPPALFVSATSGDVSVTSANPSSVLADAVTLSEVYCLSNISLVFTDLRLGHLLLRVSLEPA